MRIFAILAICALISGPALAGVDKEDLTGWGQLSETQRLEVAAIVQKKAEQASNVQVPTAAKVEPWLQLVTTLGDSLVKLAHDMGIEANELIKTPVGMMAMGLIAYHVVGDDVLDVVIGFVWFFITAPFLVLFFFKAVVPIKEYQEVEVKGLRGPKTVHKAIRRRPVFGASEDFNVDWIFVIMCALNVAVTMVIIA